MTIRAAARAAFPIAIVAALPVCLAGIQDDWLFSAPGWLDPWHYVGYGYHYAEPSFMAGYYKIARLPWILAQYAARSALSPLVANALLHVGFLILGLIAFYLLARLLFGDLPAFIASVLLGAYTHFHGSGGWDYHNTAAGPLYLLAVLLLVLAARSSSRQEWWFLGFGITFALTLHANVVFINFVPLLTLQYLACREGLPRAPLRRVLFWSAAGGVLTTVVLGLVNVSVGREFIFFGPLLDLVARSLGNPDMQAAWWRPLWAPWILEAKYLAFIVAATLVAGASLLMTASCPKTPAPVEDSATSANLQLIVAVTLWVVWQLVGHPALDTNYFAYPLIIPAFLAVAGLLAVAAGDGRKRLRAEALIIAPLAVVTLAFPVDLPARLGRVAASHIMLPVVIFLCGLLMLWRAGSNRIAFIGAVVLLVVGNAAANDSAASYAYGNRCPERRDAYLAIVDAQFRLAAQDPTWTRVRIWFDETETLPAEPPCGARSLAEIAHSLKSTGFPYLGKPWLMRAPEELTEAELDELAAVDARIVVMTNDRGTVERLIERLRSRGRAVKLVGEDLIREGRVHFRLFTVVVDARNKHERGEEQRVRQSRGAGRAPAEVAPPVGLRAVIPATMFDGSGCPWVDPA